MTAPGWNERDREMPELRKGDRISNYLLETRLGEVWRARHHVFEDVVAIKIPTDSQYVRNLQREGVAVHGLCHPNIVRAVDLDPYADPPYFVMEYVDGPSLKAMIDQHGSAFPVAAAETVLRGVLNALTASHEAGLIHRDLKPANIMLSEPVEGLASITAQAVKVTDFGLGHVGGTTTQSIMQSGSYLTEDGRSTAGTLAYMSPEQREGEPLDPRSDLYACGILLFEMLTGERPQGNESPRSLRSEVPTHLDEVFRRSYTRRERRYASAGEMLTALNTAQPRDTAPPPPPLGDAHRQGLRCPACQGLVHQDDNCCIHCGHQLVEAIPRCPACQRYVRRRDRYCDRCGKNLLVLD